MKKGDRFQHAQWLDASRMPEKIPLTCQITKIAGGLIYYRPVYDYGTREALGSPMVETVDNFHKRVSK